MKQLQVGAIREKMANILKTFQQVPVQSYINYTYPFETCERLGCKCIATNLIHDKWFFATNSQQVPEEWHKTKDGQNLFKSYLKYSDLSNVCLAILGFLVLDGSDEADRDKTLKTIGLEAQKLWHQHLEPNDIMLTIIYPTYQKLFENKYLSLIHI